MALPKFAMMHKKGQCIIQDTREMKATFEMVPFFVPYA